MIEGARRVGKSLAWTVPVKFGFVTNLANETAQKDETNQPKNAKLWYN